MSSEHLTLRHKLHVRYLLRFLDLLPHSLANYDTIRVTIAYFAISGLDVLKALDVLKEDTRTQIIKWVYSLQVIDNNELVSGFQGSFTLNTEQNKGTNALYKWSHLAMTYCALSILIILGDDLKGVDRKAIIRSVKSLQLPSGVYKAAKDGTEHDMRFLFCAASICYVLNDWSGMDIDKAVTFIKNSISYDFGISQGPGLESHGGSSYCAIATLSLSDRLHDLPPTQLEGLKRWLLKRQVDGFHGRPNKPVDTCYSFWIGGALDILGCYNLINFEHNTEYILSTQDHVIGGFSKWVDAISDPLHTYLGLAGLSLMVDDGEFNRIMPSLNITQRAHEHIKCLHQRWSDCGDA